MMNLNRMKHFNMPPNNGLWINMPLNRRPLGKIELGKKLNVKFAVFCFFIYSLLTVSAVAASLSSEPTPAPRSSFTFWPQTFWHSLRTQQSLQKEQYDKAYQHSLQALENDPLAPELHINLGNSLEGLGSVGKAKDAYGVAEKISSAPHIQFQARFNQAQALAKEKKVDEALAYYQKALELDPQSQIVKTNIELLLSSQGKGGKGDSGDQQQEDPNGKGKSDPPQSPQKFSENPKNQEKKSPQELSPGDVKKILEELKQQEQRIRGDYYKQGKRDQKQKADDGKKEKDW